MNTKNSKTTLKAILAAAAIGLTATASEAQFGNRLGGPIVSADYSGYGGGFVPNYAARWNGSMNVNNGFSGNVNLPQRMVFNTGAPNQPQSAFTPQREVLIPTQNGYVRAVAITDLNGQSTYTIGNGTGQINPSAAALAGIAPNATSVVLPNLRRLNSAGVQVGSGIQTFNNRAFGAQATGQFQIGTGTGQVNPFAASIAGIDPRASSVTLPIMRELRGTNMNTQVRGGFGTANTNAFGTPTFRQFQIGTGTGQVNPFAASMAGINPNAGSVSLPVMSKLGASSAIRR